MTPHHQQEPVAAKRRDSHDQASSHRPGDQRASAPRRPPRPGTVRTSVRVPAGEDAAQMRPAVFFDRDGTIMHDPGYCSRPEDVRLIEGAVAALERLRDAGFLLIMVTNQSGIGRGLISIEQYMAVAAELDRQLGGGLIKQTYFCPSRPDAGDPRRKPSPLMVFEAMREHGIDPRRSWMVGDKAGDMQCGRRAALRTILVQTGYGRDEDSSEASHVVRSIVEAADLIIEAAARQQAPFTESPAS